MFPVEDDRRRRNCFPLLRSTHVVDPPADLCRRDQQILEQVVRVSSRREMARPLKNRGDLSANIHMAGSPECRLNLLRGPASLATGCGCTAETDILTIRAAQLEAFDDVVLKRFGLTILSSLRDDSPQLIDGLSAEEVSLQLDLALGHAKRLKINRARDLTSFIRLCFLVGPNFCTYPPFVDILASSKTDRGVVGALFDVATPPDWERVAIRGVVDRCRKSWPAGGNAGPNVTPTVSVVPLQAEHAQAVFHYVLHPDVWRLVKLDPPSTQDHVRDLIVRDEASGQVRRFAVIGAESDFLGAMALRSQDGSVSLSYWVRRDRWGQGIATAAVKALLSIPQTRSMAPQITASIAADNLPSIRVVEKTGFAETVADGAPGVRNFIKRQDND